MTAARVGYAIFSGVGHSNCTAGTTRSRLRDRDEFAEVLASTRR
ncbi:MAG: hypothetical protein WBA98_11205 [Gordonia sp. (in: high G+C Gram-positive bacteria)]